MKLNDVYRAIARARAIERALHRRLTDITRVRDSPIEPRGFYLSNDTRTRPNSSSSLLLGIETIAVLHNATRQFDLN